MPFEILKAGIDLLMQEIVERPDDSFQLQEQLREKLAEMRGLGLPLPEDLVRLEAYLDEIEAGGEGGAPPFENLPV